jgi:hypothetical protein
MITLTSTYTCDDLDTYFDNTGLVTTDSAGFYCYDTYATDSTDVYAICG